MGCKLKFLIFSSFGLLKVTFKTKKMCVLLKKKLEHMPNNKASCLINSDYSHKTAKFWLKPKKKLLLANNWVSCLINGDRSQKRIKFYKYIYKF